MEYERILFKSKEEQDFKKEVTLYFTNNEISSIDIVTYYKDANIWKEDNYISFDGREVLNLYKFIANYI